MRFLTFLQVLGLAALLTLPTALHAQKGTDQVVEVVFTPDMDKAGLERIKQEVKAKGIELECENVDIKGGHLHALTFAVKTRVGSGTASALEIKSDDHFGFRYDPRPGAEVPFSVGTLMPIVESAEPPEDKR